MVWERQGVSGYLSQGADWLGVKGDKSSICCNQVVYYSYPCSDMEKDMQLCHLAEALTCSLDKLFFR